MALDVQVGQEVAPLVIDPVPAEPMKTVAALLHDSNPIHFDVEAVKALGMGDRVVNQGPNNMAYVVNMLADWAGGPGRVRGLRVRFLGNVFAGDRLTARGTVTGVRDEDGGRFADLDVWLERAEDDRVLDGTAVVALG
jgi:acyl dehydratase